MVRCQCCIKFSVFLVIAVLLLAKYIMVFAEIATSKTNETSISTKKVLEIEELEETYADIGLKTFVRRYEKLNVHISAPSSMAMYNDGDEEEEEEEEENDEEEEDDVHIDYLDEEDDKFEASQRRRRGSFQLDALGEHFKISYARKAPSIFADDATVTVVEDDGQRHRVDLKTATRDFVEGHLIGDVHSHVYGDLSSGFFDGVIVTADDTYYFEAADKYFRRPHQFNSVAYRASDVLLCPRGQSTTGSCSLDKEPLTSSSTRKTSTPISKLNDYLEDVDNAKSAEDYEAKAPSYGKQCRTMIVVDHTFMASVARDSDRNAINEVNIHMIASDRIFRTTDFDGDTQADGVGFKVASLQLIKRSRGYPLAGVFSDPDSFLQKVAEYDLKNFCSGFVFTFRNMRGVLGASYLGVPKKSVDGGICASRRRYKEYGNKELNLNAGFASFKYAEHNKVVPRGRSICTVAHEFGHLFGSPHDDSNTEVECNPRRNDDKYLMATKRAVDARITSRNQLFSPCSCKHIRKFITMKGHCLQ